MHFIILAPILCLLAIVAAYPIQQVRSLEVYPRTFLQTKEPAGGLTQHEVTQKIYRRGNFFSRPTLTLPTVIWAYGTGATASTAESNIAQEKATKAMEKLICDLPADTEEVRNISIT